MRDKYLKGEKLKPAETFKKEVNSLYSMRFKSKLL